MHASTRGFESAYPLPLHKQTTRAQLGSSRVKDVIEQDTNPSFSPMNLEYISCIEKSVFYSEMSTDSLRRKSDRPRGFMRTPTTLSAERTHITRSAPSLRLLTT